MSVIDYVLKFLPLPLAHAKSHKLHFPKLKFYPSQNSLVCHMMSLLDTCWQAETLRLCETSMNLSFLVFEPVSSRIFVEIEISCSQWEGSTCIHDGPYFCLLRVGWEEFSLFWLPFFQCVFNMFSSCSLEVPQILKLFPKVYAMVPQFYPIWFAQSLILMYINWKGMLLGNTLVSILQLSSKVVLPCWSIQCSQKNAHGPMNMALSPPQKKELWGHLWTN